jgi:hypothetical protein
LWKNKEYTENREHILENCRKCTVPKTPLPHKKINQKPRFSKKVKIKNRKH